MEDQNITSADITRCVLKVLAIIGLFLIASEGHGPVEWVCGVLAVGLIIYWVASI